MSYLASLLQLDKFSNIYEFMWKRHLLFSFIFICLLEKVTGQTYAPNYSQNTVLIKEADRRLLLRIREFLYYNPKYRHVNAVVSNGDVTLSGSLDRDDDRQVLLLQMRQIEGVKAVYDRLGLH